MIPTKKWLNIALVLLFIATSFLVGVNYGYYRATKEYKADLVEIDVKYALIVKKIREEYKKSKKNLEDYYDMMLEDIDTACPKENIYFFDHYLIANWVKQYRENGYLFIPKSAFNDPMTHLTERDVKKIDEMLKE